MKEVATLTGVDLRAALAALYPPATLHEHLTVVRAEQITSLVKRTRPPAQLAERAERVDQLLVPVGWLRERWAH